MEKGIGSGDILLPHSNIMRKLGLMKRKGFNPSVDIIFESFLQAMGKDATSLVPLFNSEFTSSIPFSMASTKLQMVALTEVVKNPPNAVRTGHPIYSFCAIRFLSNKFEGVDNTSAYGAYSPF